MWIALYRVFEPQPWHYIITQAQVYPKIVPKSTPDLHRHTSVTVGPYAHQQHVKVLKHYAYISYGCGIHSTGCLSLNHGIASSLVLKSQVYPKIPKIHPQPSLV
jgi:hypothetical protein